MRADRRRIGISAKHGLKSRSQVKGHLGQGHQLFRVGVKLINSRVLNVSSQTDTFYASYLRKKNLRGLHQPPPVPEMVSYTSHASMIMYRSCALFFLDRNNYRIMIRMIMK